ncbi:hypothetical protein ZIOFF_000781 [Zingiber officinale]|uniref:AP-3 complex subunit beta n=1 Tax=Zingiber officinale TaxID=94328 RepID=A0A8J5LRM1_ZINOF|nr:hypothetical protein ZIOFF_000781 [Zingiber officinale]
MFHQFSATAESLSKASSLVLRIGTDAHLYDDPDDVSIGPLLESRFDSEKVDALKRLLALLAQGSDVSQFFPQVVKNVASQSLELKKLVYLYLLHYAEKRQNEALLSINCFQKDLSDTNPLVRAWALRTMAGIRLHAVAPLVLRAITKCARDPSAYVRKCAAYALPKLYDLHHDEDNSSFEELVDILLNDHSPGVVGAAAAAFKSVCPSSLFLIAKSFRRLCEILPDVEEWGQIVLIEILLRYIIARHGIVKESIMFSLSTMSTTPVADGFPTFSGTSGSCQTLVGTTCDVNMITLMCKSYIDGQIECFAQTGCSNSSDDKLDLSLTSSTNDDVVMLLRCTSPLLWSHNSAVVLAAAGVHWIMAPRENIERIIKPLLFILRSCQASKYVILCNLLVFAKAVPPFFSQYYEDFFVCSYDTYQIRALKLEILSIIATESSIPIILQEFQDYVKDPDRRFVADTVAAIGLCAQRLPMVASACLEGLLAITFYESSLSSSSQIDGEAGVLVQAIMSIKAIIKQNPDSYDRVIVQLACNLDRIKIPAARALVIWIIGEYSVIGQIIPKVVPSILNYLAWSFTSEEPDTKLQILNTAAKVLLCAQGADSLAFRKILSYFIELAKYDINYDVRDRAHFIFKFMPHSLMTSSEKDNNSDISQNGRMHHEPGGKILNGKMHSSISSTKSSRIYLPGSLSQIVLHAASGYEPLPKPCSLLNTDLTAGVVNETNDSDISSGSSIEESGSVYDSDHSSISSDDGNESSWLDEEPGVSSIQTSQQASSGRISINNLNLLVEIFFENCSSEPIKNIALKDGESSSSVESSDQVLGESESLLRTANVPPVLSTEEIASLDPGQRVKKLIEIRFPHHLLPLKLVVTCNGKKFSTKLWPDIGYFLKPLSMNTSAFIDHERQLPGMFEYSKRCTFKDHIEKIAPVKDDSSIHSDKIILLSQILTSKVLSNCNVSLVCADIPVSFNIDDASGLCLRFSGELLSNSKPCLISILVEGKFSEPFVLTVKINCEETVFGLNLLNRVAAFLQ